MESTQQINNEAKVNTSNPLLTDFYQFTMAYGYFKLKMHEKRAAFHLIFRNHPFRSNYAVACGLQSVVEYLQNWRFDHTAIDYLSSLKTPNNQPIFSPDFLEYLANLRFTCDLYAVPEGNVVFANTPLLRIEGPLLQCQLLESPLLTILNFQTLIATKASRVVRSAMGDPVIEFGMRRAQGLDGALSASRAAYIGGCIATSNTLAGQLFNIPVKGTHAHAWVTAFRSEEEAFSAYADVLPDNGVFLVDTYDTIEGVKHAIAIGRVLRQKGSDLLGIRLDSGDLAKLSLAARQLLDSAGFEKTYILASNSLDEYVIESLKAQKAAITHWGVGTNLSTAFDQPALDGVYKLSALQNEANDWEYKLKISDSPIKVSNPGRHQIRRFFTNNQWAGDVIYDLTLGINDNPESWSLSNPSHPLFYQDIDGYTDLLQPIFKEGKLIMVSESIHQIRQRALDETNLFWQQYSNNTLYPVSLEKKLYQLKQTLVQLHQPTKRN